MMNIIREEPTNENLRNGIPVEKGVVLTTDFIEKNRSLIENWANHFLMYPDLSIKAARW